MYVYEPMPFHKAYPLEPFLTESKWMEKEKERMLSYLPAKYQLLQKQAEEACDQMEHEGSRMYDEHPDGMMIRRMAQKMVEHMDDNKERSYMEDIAACILCNEMLYRRYRFRRSKQYLRK